MPPSEHQRIPFLKKHPKAKIPTRAHLWDAGLDLEACMDQPITIEPGQTVLIPTGLAVALPQGFELQIRGRSGLNSKGFVVLFGTIDAGYSDEFSVVAMNLTGEAFEVSPGMRIAQAVIARLVSVEPMEVEKEAFELLAAATGSKRGMGGFGSSGL